MDQLLLKFQCGFRQWYNAQHFLLAMLEKQKFTVDKKKLSGEFLRTKGVRLCCKRTDNC